MQSRSEFPVSGSALLETRRNVALQQLPTEFCLEPFGSFQLATQSEAPGCLNAGQGNRCTTLNHPRRLHSGQCSCPSKPLNVRLNVCKLHQHSWRSLVALHLTNCNVFKGSGQSLPPGSHWSPNSSGPIHLLTESASTIFMKAAPLSWLVFVCQSPDELRAPFIARQLSVS